MVSDGLRVALIPGGARGIGRAVAVALADRGWAIAIAYRESSAAAEETCALVADKGVPALAIQADVSDPDAAAALVRDVESPFGRIDALVHCAGPYHRVDLLDETPDGWRRMIDHNLNSLFYVARAVAPGMIARKTGRIVTFSMANADKLLAQPQLTAHYVAKVGVLVLTRSLARSLAPHGITANTISPGFIDSGSAPAEEFRKMEKAIPAGHIGKTDDVVGAVLYLLSDEAAYVNGANLVVSGAWGI